MAMDALSRKARRRKKKKKKQKRGSGGFSVICCYPRRFQDRATKKHEPIASCGRVSGEGRKAAKDPSPMRLGKEEPEAYNC